MVELNKSCVDPKAKWVLKQNWASQKYVAQPGSSLAFEGPVDMEIIRAPN